MIFWLIHIPLIGIISYLVFLKVNDGVSFKVFTAALIIKLLAGLMVGWIFIYFYGFGDTIVFFEEASRIASLPLQDYLHLILSPSNYDVAEKPRVLFFSKFLSFFVIVTGGSYWLTSLYVSLISFFAAWNLVIVLKRLIPETKEISMICLLFMPTIVFWSSGILKDTLSSSMLALALAIILKLYYKNRVNLFEMILFGGSIFGLFKVKHYLLIALILFGTMVVFMILSSNSKMLDRLIAIVLILLSVTATQLIHPYLRFERLALTVYENNQSIYEKTEVEDRLEELRIESPAPSSILRKVPTAIQVGLLRPSLFDKTSPWGWLHRIENTMLTFLMVVSVILILKDKPAINYSLVIPALLSIFLLAVMLALSTPNFGTLVRYKNAFLPYLFLICSILPFRYYDSFRQNYH